MICFKTTVDHLDLDAGMIISRQRPKKLHFPALSSNYFHIGESTANAVPMQKEYLTSAKPRYYMPL